MSHLYYQPPFSHSPSSTSLIAHPQHSPLHRRCRREQHTFMPRYLSIRSKNKGVVSDETHSTIEDSGSTSSELSHTSKKSKIKDMSAKAAKGVKRQLRRLDDFLHHVTHTKHEPTNDGDEELEVARRRTVSVPSPVLPSSVPSFRVIRSRSAWYLRQTSNEREHIRFASVEVGIQTDEDMAHQGMSLKEEEEKELSGSEDQSEQADPTTVYVETDVPDPFLLDEEGDARSEQDKEAGSSSGALSPTHIPLDILQQLDPPTTATLNVNKDVPPPPGSEEGEQGEEEEEDAEDLPDLYLPSLILPAMFLPIPNTDPLTTLLNKYIYPPERRPPRDSTGEWAHSDYHTLVMTNSWRALAKMARDQLVAADPSDLNLILTLWYLRLSCLARLRLFNQTSAECTNLFSVLTSIEPPGTRAYVFDRVLPFELEVMYTRLKYWAGDHIGYLDALAALLKKCRLRCRAATRASSPDESIVPMWKERGARVALIMASQMVEMKELSAAIKLLEPLTYQPESSPALKSSIARIYLQAGNIIGAKEIFSKVEADETVDEQVRRMDRALLATAEGDWEGATENFRAILEKDSDHYVALNNLAVTLLNQGKAKEAIEVLESGLQASPSTVVVAEPFLFNLSTLYELRATIGSDKKKELLITVAKWSGDGLRTNCLKMPAN